MCMAANPPYWVEPSSIPCRLVVQMAGYPEPLRLFGNRLSSRWSEATSAFICFIALMQVSGAGPGRSSASGCNLARGASYPPVGSAGCTQHYVLFSQACKPVTRQITLRCGLVLGSTRCSGRYRSTGAALPAADCRARSSWGWLWGFLFTRLDQRCRVVIGSYNMRRTAPGACLSRHIA